MAKISPDILAEALSALGIRSVTVNRGVVVGVGGDVAIRWSAGKLTLTGRAGFDAKSIIGQVKRAYTAEAFKHAAARAGFKVSRRVDGKLQATRARYGG